MVGLVTHKNINVITKNYVLLATFIE